MSFNLATSVAATVPSGNSRLVCHPFAVSALKIVFGIGERHLLANTKIWGNTHVKLSVVLIP